MAHSLRKSLLITFSQSYLLLAVQFASSLIIARLLTPREIGIFSVSMVLIAIAHTLRDFGIVDYIVQERNLNPTRIRAAFTVNLIAAWTVAVLIFTGSSLLATFYKEPGVELVMRILAINFLLLPFGSIVMANLRREMRFASLALIRISVAITHAGASVAFAYLGFSYLSLALGAVSASVVNIIIVQFFRPKGFPLLPGLAEIRHVVSFGSFSSLSNVTNEAGRGSPDLILGRLMGMEAVGFFGRATGLIDLFNRLVVQSIGYVALPHFASEVRAQRSVSEQYLRSVTYLTGVAWPALIFLSIAAWPVVRLLYGGQWDEAIPLVRVLCIGELFLVPFYLFPHLLISHGFVKSESLRIGLFTVVRAVPLVVLSHLDLVVVASGYAAMSVLGFAISLAIAQKKFGIGLAEIWRATRSSLGVAALSGAAVGAVVVGFPPEINGLTAGLVAATSALLGAWLLGLMLFRHPIVHEISSAINSGMRRRRRSSGD